MILLILLAMAAFVGGIGFLAGLSVGRAEVSRNQAKRDLALHNGLAALEQILVDQLDRDEVPEAAETEWVIKLLKGQEL